MLVLWPGNLFQMASNGTKIGITLDLVLDIRVRPHLSVFAGDQYLVPALWVRVDRVLEGAN